MIITEIQMRFAARFGRGGDTTINLTTAKGWRLALTERGDVHATKAKDPNVYEIPRSNIACLVLQPVAANDNARTAAANDTACPEPAKLAQSLPTKR